MENKHPNKVTNKQEDEFNHYQILAHYLHLVNMDSLIESLKTLIQTLNGFSSLGILGLAVIIIFYLVTGRPNFLKKISEKGRKTIAGLSFEERIAYVENRQLKLETNHMVHLAEDIAIIKSDFLEFAKVQNNQTEKLGLLGERVARLEGRIRK